MNVIPHNKASDKVKYKWAFWNSVTLPRYWGPSWCHGRPDALLNDPISPESFSVFFPVLFFIIICVTLWETITEARKVELRGPPTEEEPLYKQFITFLRPVSPIPSYVSLPLSPPLCLFLFLLKKRHPAFLSPSLPANSSSVSPPCCPLWVSCLILEQKAAVLFWRTGIWPQHHL